jgi:hypothetical protein
MIPEPHNNGKILLVIEVGACRGKAGWKPEDQILTKRMP